ncbi:phage tail sheath protein [Spartinivicinus ruber]|uniref:phage tail protein n=1 Tax=Spartinivicinus ruber TaxID=2683272 RepID=UPI0013D095FA|nr:phage tail protein [Spartinivicinus ruber]
MPKINQFEHNGISIVVNEPPPPMGLPSKQVVGWVVTAPDKHADVPFNTPIRIASHKDARLLDTTGDERGTGFHAVSETLKRTQVVQYVVVVPEVEEDATATMNNIIGGIHPDTGQATGIAALALCPETPTLIAAPGYSQNKPVIDALVSLAVQSWAIVVADCTSTTRPEALTLSESLGGEGNGYERVYLVEPSAKIYSKKAKGYIYVPASTMAMGAIAAVNQWESPDNQGVRISDVMRPISYNILDKTSEGDLLNAYGISYFARTSLGGFSVKGNRAVTGKFISHVGLENVIARKIIAASERAMGKNLTREFMEAELEKLNDFLSNLAASNIIPGGNAYLHPELNNVENYRNGSWFIVLEYGRFSPNEHMTFHFNPSKKILEEFLGDIV